MSDQEICDVIQRTEDPAEAAHCLTDQAVHYSSEDNATAVVVPLGSWGIYFIFFFFFLNLIIY
jgi:protein phosphatase 1K